MAALNPRVCEHCGRPQARPTRVRVTPLRGGPENVLRLCSECARVPTRTWRLKWRPVEEAAA